MNGSNEKRKPKVLMIGIDGATLDLIKPWAKEGKLPTFKRLLDEGGHGELESVIPPVTPPAWTSLMTGMNPGKHGLFNFIDHDLADYSIRYANAGSRRVPTVWKRLSDLGWRVGVINMPMTYPPEPLNGFCISGLDTPDESSPFVYPPELKLEIERSVGKIYLDPRHLGYMTTDEKRDSVLADLVKIENRRTEIAEYLMAHHPVDVLALVYTATDTVQHFFWHYMDPAHPFYDPRGAERYRDAVLDIYRAIDSNIARLLSSVSDETAVLVVSDHGGGPVSSPVISLNRFLEEEGWLVYKKGGGA
ncbi:MAG: alkaline phosphatase family protein, partial [Candidatus Manganitrophaceae bacterium]